IVVKYNEKIVFCCKAVCIQVYRKDVNDLHESLDSYYDELIKKPKLSNLVQKKNMFFLKLGNHNTYHGSDTICRTRWVEINPSFPLLVSEKLRVAIYDGNWIGNNRLIKSLTVMLTQKPLTIRVYNFAVVSIDMFQAVINTTISYYLLLKTFEPE
ncbi:GSCOCT00014025001.2-RA-CDS, partial [Cotesia congregata]